jgi:hypothetical protein
MEKEQPIEESVREVMNDIARMIGGALAEATQNSREQYGFALLMFGLSGNEECRMSYIASVNRQDMLTAMKEFIARNEGRYEETGFTTKTGKTQ